MYAPFFGLSKEPFSIAPDPRFLFMSEQHREALAHLLYGLGGGGGFVLLTGEIGAGKTTVCRCFLEQVPETCAVAYIFNPRLTVVELLQTVCSEFGIPVPPGDSVKALVDALNAFLLQAHAQGRQAVLVIDEAQNLSADVLEQLRLLTNLETSERKLLQIVLIGQPELRDMLARPELEQLAQRVIARYHLDALNAQQTQQYIRHRLAVAGTGAALPFDASALSRIHALSGGVPRRINLLADRALLGAYAQGRSTVDRQTVQQAAREVFTTAAERAGRRAWSVPMVVLLPTLLAGGLIGWSLQRTTPPVLVVAPASASGAAASTAASGVGMAASVAPSPPLPAAAASAPSDDPAALLDAASTVPATAWRELALHWNVAIGEGDACVAATQAGLACFRSTSGGLPVVRLLDRPGLLTLRAGPTQAPRHALLLGLGGQGATLQAGGRRFELTLPALARVWRGDYATYWRTPPGWRSGAPPAAELQAWLDTRLRAAGQAAGPPLADRVRAYQLARGLPADGQAGPMTLMSLARAAAGAVAAEPRLAAGAR